MKFKAFTRMALACVATVAAASAYAIPEFTINPAAIPGVTGFSNFIATSIQGSSTELLTYNSALTSGNITGSGYVNFTGFTNDNSSTNLLSTQTGLGFGTIGGFNGYGLYVTFQLVATQDPTKSLGQAGSQNQLLSLNFQMYADAGATNTYTPANASTATQAKVNDNGTPDILLATGTFLSGTSGIDNLGGAYLNSIETFAVCTANGASSIGGVAVANPLCKSGAGSAFFAKPSPFYSLAFDAFNNTTQGVIVNGNLISIASAVGAVDFNGVPEPTTLALVGAALAGIGFAQRKRKSAK